jgi:hypothetical protein
LAGGKAGKLDVYVPPLPRVGKDALNAYLHRLVLVDWHFHIYQTAWHQVFGTRKGFPYSNEDHRIRLSKVSNSL